MLDILRFDKILFLSILENRELFGLILPEINHNKFYGSTITLISPPISVITMNNHDEIAQELHHTNGTTIPFSPNSQIDS